MRACGTSFCSVGERRPTGCAKPAWISPKRAFPTSNSTIPLSSISSCTVRLPSISGMIFRWSSESSSPVHRLGAVRLEHQVQRGDLLLDQAPLVDPPRPLQQEVLRVDRHLEGALFRALVGLEVEGALRPGEEEVDRLLDLDADVVLHLVARDGAAADQDLAQPLARRLRLVVDGGEEVPCVEQPVLDEQVAQPVAPVDDGGVADAPALEVDVARSWSGR
jgi:hypothetical protein